MGDGVPYVSIVRKDIAPVLAAAFYGLGSEDDRVAARNLIQVSFDSPRNFYLLEVLGSTGQKTMKGTIPAIRILSSTVLSILKQGLVAHPLIANREAMPSYVYDRLVEHEFQSILCLAITGLMPDRPALTLIVGTGASAPYVPGKN